jgi:HSP20 family protein
VTRNFPAKRGSAANMSSWDPFKDLLSIQERVNRLFEDATGSGGQDPLAGGTWSPVVDICETETEYLVRAEVPEVKRSDIDIRVRGNTLTIEGERKLRRTGMEGYHRLERVYGRFQRSFLLPGSVDQDSITALLKDGILKIVLPKKRETIEKRREVTTLG